MPSSRTPHPIAGVFCIWVLVVAGAPLDGTLVAGRDCPATVSIRRGDNPGQVRLVPGRSYRVLERNRADATHYLLRIEGAQPQDRWVATDCGTILAESLAAPAPAGAGAAASASMEEQYVLALSWQPAFCERRQDKPECRNRTSERPDARAFSLHGLWPQPIGRAYCGVSAPERAHSESGDWARLPDLRLAPATRSALETRMPGTRSHLERHEWLKHGTCYGSDPDRYFSDAMALLDQLNGSAVQDLIESNLGRRLRAEEVRAAFDRAFGRGAGDRVRLECDPEGNIAELRIGLKGPIGTGADLGGLIRAAPPRTAGCRGGWVNRVGPGR
jgi:ribonuclease T2